MSAATDTSLSEADHAEALARHRWGPTGFRCPHCQHDRAYLLRNRPRMRECRNCGRQTSVTSGTLLHRTRLPLSCWADRGQHLEQSPRIPTSTELSVRHQIARSTAWLLNQKMMCVSFFALEGSGLCWLMDTPVRRPRPRPPMVPSAPAHVQELHARHLNGRPPSLRVLYGVEVVGPYTRLEQVCVPEGMQHRYRRAPSPDFDPGELHRWLRAGLVLQHRTVSLRWLPRWLGAMLAWWNRRRNELNWARAALALEPRPLRQLDPWL